MRQHRFFVLGIFCTRVIAQDLPSCVVNVQNTLISQAQKTQGCSSSDLSCICDYVEYSADWADGIYCWLAGCDGGGSGPYPIATSGIDYFNSICNAQLTPFAVCPNILPILTTRTVEATATATRYVTLTAYSPRLTVTSYTATASDATGTRTVTAYATVTAARRATKRGTPQHMKRQDDGTHTFTVTNGAETIYYTDTTTYTNDCNNNPVASCYTTVYGTSFDKGQALTTVLNTVTVVSPASVTASAQTTPHTTVPSTTSRLNSVGGDLSNAPLEIGKITTPILLPTTPYTGQALLTGTCTEAFWTAVVLDNGVIMEFPIVGCNDNNPGCCPSLPVSLSPSSACPSPTNAAEVLLPICPNEEVPDALAANPLSECPSDYILTGSVCCPYGFSIYNQRAMGQTPCYIDTTPLPTPSTLGDFKSSLVSAIQATASAGSSPSVTVDVVTTQVFALSLPHKPSSSGLSTGAQAGIGVGAALGGIIFLLSGCWAFLFARRRRKARESTEEPSAAGTGSVAATDPFTDRTSTGQVSPYQPSHSTQSGGMSQPAPFGAQTYYPPPPVPAGVYGREYPVHYHPTGSPSPPLPTTQQPGIEEQRRELSGNPQAQMLHGSDHYPNEMSATPSPGWRY